MSFISSRNKDLGIGIIEVLCEKSPLGVKKQYVFRNKRANNLETFWYILKKSDTRLDILTLKNWGKFATQLLEDLKKILNSVFKSSSLVNEEID